MKQSRFLHLTIGKMLIHKAIIIIVQQMVIIVILALSVKDKVIMYVLLQVQSVGVVGLVKVFAKQVNHEILKILKLITNGNV